MGFVDFIIILGSIGFIAFNTLMRNPDMAKKVKNFFEEKKSAYNSSNSNGYNAYSNNNSSSQTNNNSNFFGNISPNKIANYSSIIIALILSIYLISGFYIVQPEQQGIETRFGKYSVTTDSGLHYHLPYPFEKVYKLNVTSVNTEEIGYRSSDNGENYQSNEGIMITKDENIVDVNFDVQWRINDAKDYVFNIKNQDIKQTIRDIAESVMREIVGQNNMFFVLGEGRAIVAENTRKTMQEILDQYKIGIHILSVPIKKIDPPKEVISAFRDVQSARADKEKDVNLAQAYRNDVIPKAKGKAAQIINEAEAYFYETVNKATGEVARMMSLYPMYKSNSDLTKIRLYTDLMNDIMPDKKIIIGSENSNQVNLINPSEFIKNIATRQNNTENK